MEGRGRGRGWVEVATIDLEACRVCAGAGHGGVSVNRTSQGERVAFFLTIASSINLTFHNGGC